MYPAIKDSKFLLKGLKIYKVTSRQGNSSNILYVCDTCLPLIFQRKIIYTVGTTNIFKGGTKYILKGGTT
jgi:hypothetical protein